jgi:hypothetical protein
MSVREVRAITIKLSDLEYVLVYNYFVDPPFSPYLSVIYLC